MGLLSSDIDFWIDQEIEGKRKEEQKKLISLQIKKIYEMMTISEIWKKDINKLSLLEAIKKVN